MHIESWEESIHKDNRAGLGGLTVKCLICGREFGCNKTHHVYTALVGRKRQYYCSYSCYKQRPNPKEKKRDEREVKEDELRSFKQKVMISLLTMSCVYLGGTSVLPMAEASMVDGNTVHGVVKSYSDNSTLTGANIVIYAGSSETTDITAEGKLKLENTSANVPVIGTVSNGKINLNGDTITVENTGNDYSNSVVFAESGSNIYF